MVGQVYSENGVKKIRNLAGSVGGGLPIGTIIAQYSNTVPSGYLPCTGVQFDRTQYPALYTLLGDDHTPDLRESGLVGAGQSTRQGITAHDVYTVGQFKDDQVQQLNVQVDASDVQISVNDPGHTHTFTAGNNGNANIGGLRGRDVALYDASEPDTTVGLVHGTATGATQSTNIANGVSGTTASATTGITATLADGSITATTSGYRNGATTHGKQVGVTYVIKAVTGTTDLADPDVYQHIVATLQTNYIEKDQQATWVTADNILIMYDATTNKFKPCAYPTGPNQVLTATATLNSNYSFDNGYLNADLTTTTNTLTNPTEKYIGQMRARTVGATTKYYGNLYIYAPLFTISTDPERDYYTIDANGEAHYYGTGEQYPTTDHWLSQDTMLQGAPGVLYDDKVFVKYNPFGTGTTWYWVYKLDTAVMNDNLQEVTDTELLAILEAMTPLYWNAYAWSKEQETEITALSPNGLVFDDTSILYNLYSGQGVSYHPVNYRYEYDSALVYNWKNLMSPAGSSTNPIYIDLNGNATASNATVGDITTPVYMDSGVIKPCSLTASIYEFSTATAYNEAIAIPEGSPGYIPNGSVVILDYETSYLEKV